LLQLTALRELEYAHIPLIRSEHSLSFKLARAFISRAGRVGALRRPDAAARRPYHLSEVDSVLPGQKLHYGARRFRNSCSPIIR
jgi:hypothetical protein